MEEGYLVWRSVFSILWKVLLFVSILLLASTHWVSDSLLFRQIPASYARDYRYFGVETASGYSIACRFLSNQSSRYLIIYSHGNAEDLGHIEGLLKGFRGAGLNVLAYDYPGYGLSGGKASEKACYNALEAVIRFAHEKLGFPKENIILHGRSLGAGPAVEMCKRGKYGGLIIESAFISAFKVVIGIDWLPWDRFRNLRKISSIEEPTLVIHGGKDEVVPFSHGQALFEALKSPKLYYWADTAGHNDLVAYLGDEYWTLISDFIRYLAVENGEK